jgi:MFS family permease
MSALDTYDQTVHSLKGTVRGRAAAVIGNGLEYYDFTLYAFFAAIIGKNFFPADSELGSLFLSVAVFGVGFLARPLGAVIIGSYADRRGRKPAMLLTMALMAIGILAIIVTPPYAVIGIAAPIIIVIARLLQGFAWGGESGPITSFLVESAPHNKRGYYASWQVASQGLAVLFAGTAGVVTSSLMTPEMMTAWGWRIPFVLGLAIVPVGYFLRNKLEDTAEAAPEVKSTQIVSSVLFRYTGTTLLCVMVLIPGTVTVYVNNYMTSYALTILHLPITLSISINMAVGATMMVAALVSGMLSDRFGRKPVMLLPCLGLMLVAIPAFTWLSSSTGTLAVFAVPILLATLTGLHVGGVISGVPEAFPKAIRSTGVSMTYALAATVFGGSTQFVVTWLLSATGNPTSPAWWIVGACVIGLCGMLMFKETADASLKE